MTRESGRGAATGELNFAWAREIVSALLRLGVTEVEIAPGSRSAPLVLAVRSFAEITARVHMDERSAGFFALGYGRRAGRPAAVVTTSGTAVANLLPAVVEADASDVPLIVLSADRPPALRGADANQTIDQVGIFGSRPRFEADLPVPASDKMAVAAEVAERAARDALGPPPGPVHINVPFCKPLEPRSTEGLGLVENLGGQAKGSRGPAGPGTRVPVARRSPLAGRDADFLAEQLRRARRPLLVAGPSVAPDIEGPLLLQTAASLGAPLLADALSGARFAARDGAGHTCCGAYDHFLRLPETVEKLAPDLVIRTGRTPTSAVLESALEHWRSAVQIVIDAGRHRKDHQRLARTYIRDDATLLQDLASRVAPAGGAIAERAAWTDLWQRAEAAAWSAVKESEDDSRNEGAYAAALVGALPQGSTLFVSNSMPVRDVDAYGKPAPLGVRVLGNRGASGIDGIVSSVLGCAAGGSGPVVGFLGDLAFCHDMNGLLAARDSGLNVVFVLVDNDGGGIFHLLPIRAFEPAFTPFFATPHGLDFRHAARLYGVPMRRASTPAALAEAVASGTRRPGTEIVCVRSEREANRRCHENVRAKAARRAADAVHLRQPEKP